MNLLNEKISSRYLSLDVFRGLTVALMIVVNNPGSWSNIYPPFKHSVWHGFTLTDLVFPTFLFVVGNALSFSTKKFSSMPSSVFLLKVFKRTLIIFLIGLFLNGFPFFHYVDGNFVIDNLFDIRIWGVLQRIALCYGIASLMIYYFQKNVLILSSILVLLFYWLLLFCFGDIGAQYSLKGNAVAKLDLVILNPSNLYHGFGVAFDPEGLLSTLPAIVNVIAGYFVGKFIQENGNKRITILKMLASSLLFIAIAQLWDMFFPINKPIWTSSYVLYSVGLDILILVVLIYIIEILAYKKWAYFFEIFGKNPLFIYALSAMLIRVFYMILIREKPLAVLAYDNFYNKLFSDKNASLLFALSYMLILWGIAYFMDKRKIYIKV